MNDTETQVARRVIREDKEACILALSKAVRELRELRVTDQGHVYMSSRSRNHVSFELRVSSSFMKLIENGDFLPGLKTWFKRTYKDATVDTSLINDYGQVKVYFTVRRRAPYPTLPPDSSGQ